MRSTSTRPSPESRSATELDAAALAKRLAQAEKTIAVLANRVEGHLSSGQSAFAVLEQNVVLTRVVSERTAELASTVERLRQTQDDLLQSQKLESVGRLAAGVAHEINTPVQFVGDSVHFLLGAFQDLLSVVATYRGLLSAVESGAPIQPALARARAAEDAADVEYLTEQVPLAIDRSLEGLGRVASLVRSMKDFAYPHRNERRPADINQALSSALTIASGECKLVADTSTDFGILPPVPCVLGELNQVFLNLIVNAAHAIGEHQERTGKRGRIHVQTRHEEEVVRVSIADDGPGISHANRSRVFEPFFTTKPPGKGTGQGLAIAHSVVVQRHRGTLTFDSVPGRGTTFHVRLPIDPAPSTAPAAPSTAPAPP